VIAISATGDKQVHIEFDSGDANDFSKGNP
jgi:hypothetical protein